MIRGLFVLAGTIAIVMPAQAQDAFSKVDRATASQLRRIVDQAEARGLPTEPIVAKANLGATMRAPAARIVAAAEAVESRLEQARDALAPSPSPVDIVAGEDALSVGVSAASLKRVRAASPRQSVAVPLGVLAQLVVNRVDLERATDIVINLIARGATNTQFVALGNDVRNDIALGGNPDAALDIRLRGLAPLLGAPQLGGDKATVPAATTTPGPKKP